MAVEHQRPDGWIVTYVVEIVFDTSRSRTRYDHVGSVARCTGCGERLDAASSPAALVRHARLHEPTCVADGAHAETRIPVIGNPALASLRREEVTTEHTTS